MKQRRRLLIAALALATFLISPAPFAREAAPAFTKLCPPAEKYAKGPEPAARYLLFQLRGRESLSVRKPLPPLGL
jgi:hypothetical protein